MCYEEEGVPMILLFTILCVILLAITSIAFVFLLRDTACDNKDDFQCFSDHLFHDYIDPFECHYSHELYSIRRNDNEV